MVRQRGATFSLARTVFALLCGSCWGIETRCDSPATPRGEPSLRLIAQRWFRVRRGGRAFDLECFQSNTIECTGTQPETRRKERAIPKVVRKRRCYPCSKAG